MTTFMVEITQADVVRAFEDEASGMFGLWPNVSPLAQAVMRLVGREKWVEIYTSSARIDRHMYGHDAKDVLHSYSADVVGHKVNFWRMW